LNRCSKEILVRLFLVIACVILFLFIFSVAKRQVDEEDITHNATATTEATESLTYTVPYTTEQPLLDYPVLYVEAQYVKPIIPADALNTIDLLDYFISSIELECDSGLYTERAVAEMLAEIERLNAIKNQLYNDIGRFNTWESTYPEATQVWYFLRDVGFSEEVTAGIIGNMMVETAGGTLVLKPTIYDSAKAFYGLCQWSLYYNPGIANKSMEEQLLYLRDSIASEFSTFGFCYKKNFTYEDFLALQTPEEAADAFAKVYERCAGWSYNMRKQAAAVAYEYFTSDSLYTNES
jgi:hypothetical protein